MKKLLAAALTLSLLVAVFPLSALADDIESVEGVENESTSATTDITYTAEPQPMAVTYAVKIPTTLHLDKDNKSFKIDIDDSYELPENFGVTVKIDTSSFSREHSTVDCIELKSTTNSAYYKDFVLYAPTAYPYISSRNTVFHYVNGTADPDGNIRFQEGKSNEDPNNLEYTGSITFNITGAYE